MNDSVAAPVFLSDGPGQLGRVDGREAAMLVWVVRIASAILLLAIGGIHLFLVLYGVGGILGVLFVLNALAGVVLAAGILLLRGRLVAPVAVLGLLFSIASLLALLTALTIGLFGIHERWTFTLVPQTVVVDSIAVVVLAITSAVLVRVAPGGRGRARADERPGQRPLQPSRSNGRSR